VRKDVAHQPMNLAGSPSECAPSSGAAAILRRISNQLPQDFRTCHVAAPEDVRTPKAKRPPFEYWVYASQRFLGRI